MGRFKIQVALLVLLLAVPGFVYLFLQFFGSNTFDVRVLHPVEVHQDTLPDGKITSDTVFYTLPEFSFPSEPGDQLHSEDLEGSIHIAAFIKWPLSSDRAVRFKNQLRRLQSYFGEIENVKVIGYLANARRDLSFYSSRLGFAEHPNFLLASGEQKELSTLALETYRMNSRLSTDESCWNRWMVLVDSQKRIRGYYNVDDKEETDRLIDELNIIYQNMQTP